MTDATYPPNLSQHTQVMPDPCWVWNGAISGGYGSAWDGQQVVWAHRLAYQMAHGPIPDGMTIDHAVCRNTLCVNPAHLELVTRSENAARGNRHRISIACKHGHLLLGDNLGTASNGRRYCRTCKAEANKRATAKRRARRQESRA